jgi:hypothetical protein
MAGGIGPLAQMMIDNGSVIESAIEEYGPSAVAEFFVNVGTSMAALYETADVDGDKEIPVINEGV